MTEQETAARILDTLLGHLGVAATVDREEGPGGGCLQIRTTEGRLLTGRDGERLDDLQYLVNRILLRQFPQAARVRVDCEHFRSMREDMMASEVREIAERVKATGRPHQLRPLNAYYRRLVYGILTGDPDLEAKSPEGEQRLKRITIAAKHPPRPGS